MNDELILKKLGELISEGERLCNLLDSYYDSDLKRYHTNMMVNSIALKKWKGAAINLLKVRFGKDSEYYQDFRITMNQRYKVRGSSSGEFFKENVAEATGVLAYISDAIENGLTDDLFYKREILVLSDLLKQAFEFLDQGLSLASAIYGRIILETTVKEYAQKHNISASKFDQLIIKLRQGAIIHKPFENSLRANYGIGSLAAHGDEKFQKLSDKEIKEFLTFIRDRVLTLE